MGELHPPDAAFTLSPSTLRDPCKKLDGALERAKTVSVAWS